MFCVEKHTGQCRTLILHQNHVIVGNASVIKRSKPSHCQYPYCTYGLESVCLAVMISKSYVLEPLDYSDLVPR